MFHTSRLIGWLAALLLIMGGGYFLYSYFALGQARLAPDFATLWQLKRGGDTQAILSQYQKIQADPNKSAQEKAAADLYVAGVQFSATGSQNDVIQEVQKMKKIVANTQLPPEQRAAALAILGNEYSVWGKNDAVFAEIYKDPPFSAYLVAGNPDLSSLNLEKAAYEMHPTSFAAIKSADILTAQYFLNPKQSASTTAAYVTQAEDYLKNADIAVIDELRQSNSASYKTSDAYIMYQLSRAKVIGRLAVEKGSPYIDTYQNQFEAFIKAAQSGGDSVVPKNSLVAARFQYAIILGSLKEKDKEKEQLDLLAKDMDSLKSPATTPLILSFKAAYKDQTGSTWHSIQAMSALSPDFAAAVNKYVIASTQ